MNLRSLTASDFDTVHATFLEAFSDYVVKLAPTREQLTEMLTRRGWVPELSVGVFDDDRLVAFTLNGFDHSFSEESGYDSGTGVIPSHRKRGLARQTMEWSRDRLRDAGAKRYVLEVLEANTPAAALYRSCGFVETRRLQSWTFACHPERSVGPGGVGGTQLVPEWQDIQPSWQNSTPSIARAGDPHLILGDTHSYAILFPSNGDVAQLAVDPAHRRRGLGTKLLNAACEAAGKPLRIMNVDTRDEGITAFLEKVGAARMVVQLEMVLTITP